MGNNIPPPLPLGDPVQDDDDIYHNNTPTTTQSVLQDMYQPPVSCISLTDINPTPPNLPPPRSILVVLRMPRVPFIVNRVMALGGTTIGVTCGVVPLRLCHSYDDFMFELRLALSWCLGEPSQGNPSLEHPIPGYDLWYEMMGPVERRVAFGRHSWEVFKARVRLVVLRAL